MSIYDPATYDIRTAVPPMVARVRSAFLDALEDRLAPFDLKAADYLVLVALANDSADTASSPMARTGRSRCATPNPPTTPT